MHNVFDIGPAVRREFLTVTLSVEGYTDLKNIVHFYSPNGPRRGPPSPLLPTSLPPLPMPSPTLCVPLASP
ncbi:hypothetical protein D6D25_03987 [Aureobasidium pullulans]|nr:hypothetical protein D6D25_03987 [Aureobasidium pullulans]